MTFIPRQLFLIGPMGSGKTTVGRALAERWGLQFIDVDEAIEARSGVEVDRIFEVEGEAGFRARETRMLQELAGHHHVVIATGGGSVLAADNRTLLKSTGVTVWLKTSVTQQLRRLARDRRRPLLQSPDRKARLEAMAKARDPLYAECADIIVPSANLTPALMAERAAEQISEQLSNTAK